MPLDSIFLSASVPDPDRNPAYFTTGDSIAIGAAVIALMRVALPRTRVVFGGHPAITPMVKWVAEKLNSFHKVRMFQSMYFRDLYLADLEKFNYEEVEAVPMNRDASLDAMRTTMLNCEPFSAAFFIGGMEGVEAEYKMLRKLHPNVPCFPIYTTGGAARHIWKVEKELPLNSPLRGKRHDTMLDLLRHDNAYMSLFSKIVDDLDNENLPAAATAIARG